MKKIFPGDHCVRNIQWDIKGYLIYMLFLGFNHYWHMYTSFKMQQKKLVYPPMYTTKASFGKSFRVTVSSSAPRRKSTLDFPSRISDAPALYPMSNAATWLATS